MLIEGGTEVPTAEYPREAEDILRDEQHRHGDALSSCATDSQIQEIKTSREQIHEEFRYGTGGCLKQRSL